jgi:hypothetical protein
LASRRSSAAIASAPSAASTTVQPSAGEHAAGEVAQQRLVLGDDDHGLVTVGCRVARERQQDAHIGALPGRALDADPPACPLGEGVGAGEPEPRAPADPLGGEERLEGAGTDLGRHARAVVGDDDLGVRTGRDVELRGLGALDRAALGHVDRQAGHISIRRPCRSRVLR